MKVKVILRSMEEIMQDLRPQEKVNVLLSILIDIMLSYIFFKMIFYNPKHPNNTFRFFTRPFVGTIDGHVDGVLCMAKNLIICPIKPLFLLLKLFSGFSFFSDHSGILINCFLINSWDMVSRRTVCQYAAHLRIRQTVECPITGVGESEDSSRNLSEVLDFGNTFWCISSGAQVGIWDHNSSFNPGEPNLCDRSIVTYDLRMSSPVRKLIMKARNFNWIWLSWNHHCTRIRIHGLPLNLAPPSACFFENFYFANEDCNCYSYDARKLDEAKCVHQEHVSAVMDIDYSPTGREFVTGSYGRTVRIFQYNGGRSREIYHTKRMQSCDGTYLISGSDGTNLRLWKAKASEQPGVVLPRERKKQECLEAKQSPSRSESHYRWRTFHLVNTFCSFLSFFVYRHRHLPKPIYKAANLRRTMIEADRTKEKRRKAHSAPRLSIPAQPYRKRRIIREVE
ncbi:unnamed protein product [Spirodela intermedia]|uniref:Sof1-like protein domain-containing protein n=1 Tax=Spirodela intermedia TaxID=51605 RepID=A0A7I8JEI5_SPIIN|nr:unnamed protein product [Spirodela intermedia]CAA6668560.1 unnamed protein product [Spirodela intermedia]